jgi:hypothetical protein
MFTPHTVVSMTSPEPASTAVVRPGAFRWRYLDALASDGSGLVLITGFGLPFLPHQRGRVRSGAPGATGPSVALSLYQKGRPWLYLLQETPDDGDRSGDRFGRTTWDRTVGGRTDVVVNVDMDLPSQAPIRGTIRLSGPTVGEEVDLPGTEHRWRLRSAAARVEASLSVGGERFEVAGRGYHDENEASEPLWDQDIAWWIWGRAPAGRGDAVWYVCWPKRGDAPQGWWIDVGEDGRRRRTAVRASARGWRPGWFGLVAPAVVELQGDGVSASIHQGAVLDDGPFYRRHLARVVRDGVESVGIAEHVVPSRLDPWWMRPLVDMAVHRPAGGSSLFLPLFSGTRAGRLGRLAPWWFGRSA